MICIQLNGGLGNQMFQYACGRALAIKHNTEFVFDLTCISQRSKFSHQTKRSLEVSVFGVNVHEVNKGDLKRLKPLAHRLINVISLRLNSKGIQKPNYFIERTFSYDTAIENVSSNCFLIGYWQSPLYFQSIQVLIRQDFKFPELVNQTNIDYMKYIETSNSVSLHIRRADFVDNSYHDIHGACSLEYYKKAVDLISEKIIEPVFFVFSDDIAWARENLQLNHDIEFVSGNLGNKSYVDMQLMSSCKHNIIANSSFSWWGAWLNGHPNKMVIAPLRWFTTKLNDNTFDLIPDSWLRI